MAIYYPDGNGGRKAITAADISVAGFSNVSGATGAITDEDNLLTALAKLSNGSGGGGNARIQIPVPTQANTLTYNGAVQEPVWLNYSESKMTKLNTGTNSATDAGTYLTYFTLEAGYEWADGTLGDKSVEWRIDRAKIANVPEQDGTLTYNGEAQSPMWRYFDETKMTISGAQSKSAIGTYTAYFTPTKNYTWADGTTGSKAVSWSIGRITINTVPSQSGTLTFTGSAQSPTWKDYDETKLTISGTTNRTDAGTYTASFTPKAGYAWADGTTTSKPATWVIKEAPISKIPSPNGTLTYNGEKQSPTWNNYNTAQLTIGGTYSATNAGTYTARFTPKRNYVWADGTAEYKSVDWAIAVVKIAKVTLKSNTLTYTGELQSPVWENFDETQIKTSGTISHAYAGDYTAKFTPKANYVWADGTDTTLEFPWTIKKAAGDMLLSMTSVMLRPPTPSVTIVAKAKATGTATDYSAITNIAATSADSSLCAVSIEENIVTITGLKRGKTTVTITWGGNSNYEATSVAVPVDVNTAPVDMLSGRTLAQLQTIFRNGQAAQYFKAGDYFNVTFASDVELASGNKIAANSTYRAVLLGIDHNSTLEGTKRGHFCIGQTTDGMDCCFYSRQMNSTDTNAGGWNGSEMKTWLNDTFYNALPTDLKNVITSCVKYTDNTGGGTNAESAVTSSGQKIWLMSEFEIFGPNVSKLRANEYEQAKQAQYDFYKNDNDTERVDANTSLTGDRMCWLRSPYVTGGTGFCVNSNLGSNSTTTATRSCGVVPCFTIS